MEKIYCIDKALYSSSESALKDILARDYQISNAVILRNENGKPYLKNEQTSSLFFSITHTKKQLFIIFSDENIGIDAEPLSRQAQYASIIKSFPLEEQEEISSNLDFLRHWTAKESAIKWLGGSIAKDLKNLAYINQKMQYKHLGLPIHICFLEYENVLIAICASKDNVNPEIISIQD